MRSLLDASMDRLKGRVGALATAILEVAAWFAPGLPIPLPQLVVAAQLLRYTPYFRPCTVFGFGGHVYVGVEMDVP